MKAFVIKSNNDRLYLSNSPFYKWTNDFCEARIEKNREDIEQILDQVYPRLCSGKIVEITITEGELEKEIEHWHNLFKQKEQQFQSVRERYHLLNRLQANYDKKDKLHLSEMQCLELVEKNEKLQQELAEKDKEIEELERYLQLERAFTPARGDGKTFTRLNIIQDFKNLIRKQVCDELREFIDNNEHSEENEAKQSSESVIYTRQLYNLLDQIEQAKENELCKHL